MKNFFKLSIVILVALFSIGSLTASAESGLGVPSGPVGTGR